MTKKKNALKTQISALKNLPEFFKLVWETNKSMTIWNVILRVVKASIPLLILYVGKEIIDEIIRLVEVSDKNWSYLWILIGIELGLAVFSDLTNRVIILLDSLLGDLFSNKTSVQLIKHSATLDLYQFENPDFYDKLERARRQTTGRTVLMTQVLAQFQDVITILFLGIGLIAFNPWLILILFYKLKRALGCIFQRFI